MARFLGSALLGLVLGAGACQAQESCPPQTLRAAAAEGDAAQLEACLADGADLNAANADGVTALMLAAARGQAEVVEALLEGGADVDAATANDGVTALMVAAAHGQTVIVRTLVRGGEADVAIEDAGGRTALDWASAQPYTTGDNAVAITQFLQSPRVGAERGSGGDDPLPDLAAMLERAAGD